MDVPTRDIRAFQEVTISVFDKHHYHLFFFFFFCLTSVASLSLCKISSCILLSRLAECMTQRMFHNWTQIGARFRFHLGGL